MRWLLLIALLIPTYANAGGMWGSPKAYSGGGSCATQSVDIQYTDTGDTLSLTSFNTKGQELVFSTSGELHRLVFNLDTLVSASYNITLRIGISADLTTVYMGEVVTNITSTGDISFIFSAPIAVTSGTTYYVFLHSDSGDSNLLTSNNGGSQPNYWYDNGSQTWAPTNNITYLGLYMEAYLCD